MTGKKWMNRSWTCFAQGLNLSPKPSREESRNENGSRNSAGKVKDLYSSGVHPVLERVRSWPRSFTEIKAGLTPEGDVDRRRIPGNDRIFYPPRHGKRQPGPVSSIPRVLSANPRRPIFLLFWGRKTPSGDFCYPASSVALIFWNLRRLVI
jgi:hypothetical protein